MTHHWRDAKPKAADRLNASFRKIPEDELRQVLNSHDTWVRTDGARGFPADLAHGDLSGQDFSGMRLDGADLSGARLERANFSGAFLKETNLKEAHLEKADLSGANFNGAFFGGARGLETADLTGADFTAVQGLSDQVFAGQDLTGVVLPGILETFGGVRQVDALSKPARSMFLGLMGACLYAWLVIGAATDSNLIVNAPGAPLPILQASVPLVGFFVLAPGLLFVLYLYLHLYLQRLWQELGALPAVFPDGRPLHLTVFPWLLTCLAPWHVGRLKERRAPTHWLQVALTVFAAWVMTPLTLFAFWARSLPRHDGVLSFYLLVLVLFSVGAGLYFYQQAERALRPEPSWFDRKWREIAGAVAASILLLAFWVHAVAAFGGGGWQIDTLGLRTFAHLEGAALSHISTVQPSVIKRAGVSRERAWPGAVIGASFEGRDFRNAQGAGMFAAMGHFNRADFYGADLYASVFAGADMIETRFTRAVLSRADFSDVTAIAANFTLAVLYRTNLSRADLSGANLARADLGEANLTAATLRGADISGANLSTARGVTQEQLRSACGDAATQLPPIFDDFSLPLCSPT